MYMARVVSHNNYETFQNMELLQGMVTTIPTVLTPAIGIKIQILSPHRVNPTQKMTTPLDMHETW